MGLPMLAYEIERAHKVCPHLQVYGKGVAYCMKYVYLCDAYKTYYDASHADCINCKFKNPKRVKAKFDVHKEAPWLYTYEDYESMEGGRYIRMHGRQINGMMDI